MATIPICRTSASSLPAKRCSWLLAVISIAAAAAQTSADPGGALYSRPFDAFQNKTLAQKVQELADREEIRELVARYAHRVAHGVSLADLFTDDGAFIVRMPGRPAMETRGRAALDRQFATIAAVAAQHPTLPMIHNYLLQISGNEATGTCSIEIRTTENGHSVVGSGYYEDRYRREHGRWKFVVRDAHFFHWVTLQEGWASAPAQ